MQIMTDFTNRHSDYKANEWEHRTPKPSLLYRCMSDVAKKQAWIDWKLQRRLASWYGIKQLSWANWLAQHRKKYL